MPTVDLTNTGNNACAANDAMSMPYLMPTQALMTTSHTMIAVVSARLGMGLVINRKTASGAMKVSAV